jgi:acyl dehydratase
MTAVGPITRSTIARYAGASGDFNPVDEEFAHAAGMPSVFAHGLFTAGLLGQHLARRVGQENVRSFGVRFTGQVWPGDELTISDEVERVEDGVTHLVLTVTRQTGDVVLKGTATARVA